MRPVSGGQILAGAALGMGNLLPAGAELPNQGAASVRTGAGSVRARASKYRLNWDEANRGHAACKMASTVAVLRRTSSLRRSAGTCW